MEKNTQLQYDNLLEEIIRNPKEYLERKKGKNMQQREVEDTLNSIEQIQNTLDQGKSAVPTKWTC